VSTHHIPVLDFEQYKSGSSEDRRFFSLTLGKALQEIGFIELKNHPVAEELFQNGHALANEFFQLPLETKRTYCDPQFFGQRGYAEFTPPGTSRVVPEYKEAWHFGREENPVNMITSLGPRNIWPSEVNFKKVLPNLFQELEILALDLLDACSLFLNLPSSYFRDFALNGMSFLRILHYPELTDCFEPNRLRLNQHEDLSLLTLLWSPRSEGLEILNPQGDWIKVYSSPSSVLVNVGELLSYSSCGVFRSAPHRVAYNPSLSERRLSMPFFLIPAYHQQFRPPEPLTVGEYIAKRLSNLPKY
jgi:isopenicillin N synthase-like dioxygenase